MPGASTLEFRTWLPRSKVIWPVAWSMLVVPVTVTPLPNVMVAGVPGSTVMPVGRVSRILTSLPSFVIAPSGRVSVSVTSRASPGTTVRFGYALSALSSAESLEAPTVKARLAGVATDTVASSAIELAEPPTGVPSSTNPSPAATPPATAA